MTRILKPHLAYLSPRELAQWLLDNQDQGTAGRAAQVEASEAAANLGGPGRAALGDSGFDGRNAGQRRVIALVSSCLRCDCAGKKRPPLFRRAKFTHAKCPTGTVLW